MARESAIGINAPGLSYLLDQWRIPTVEVATRGIPPHVTLLYPWRPAPLQPSDVERAMAALAGTRRFTLRLPTIDRFLQVIYLRAEPDDVLRGLMQRLAMAFPETPPYGGAFPDPTPHLTVAKGVTDAELDRLEIEIVGHLAPHLPLVVDVSEIALEEQGEDGFWSIRATVPLADG
jgi:2'-5' RNA ligase